MVKTIGDRLEKYTTIHPEVLMVTLQTSAGEEDIVVIYGGFSSSLVKPTNFDPDIPIIEAEATITNIDRLASPYNPDQPQYIQEGLSLTAMEKLLVASSL